MKPDIERAKRFLMALRPRGPWTLTAIAPDEGPLVVNTFAPGYEAKLADWVRHWNTTHGIYFVANPLRKQAFRRRCSEFMRKDEFLLDVLAFQYVGGDFDPPSPDIAPKEWASTCAKLFRDTKWKPTMFWRSGYGMQALWQIKPAVPLDDDNDKVRECKLVAKGLLAAVNKALGITSDAVGSLDHVFRLPGTVNLPNKIKRAKGRVPILAGNHAYIGATYHADMLPKATAKAKRPVYGLAEPPGGWDQDKNIPYAVLSLKHTKDVSREGVSGAAWRTALHLRDWGISADKAIDLMFVHWLPRCEYEWDEDELRDKVKRAYDSAENDPGCKTAAYRTAQARGEFSISKDFP